MNTFECRHGRRLSAKCFPLALTLLMAPVACNAADGKPASLAHAVGPASPSNPSMNAFFERLGTLCSDFHGEHGGAKNDVMREAIVEKFRLRAEEVALKAKFSKLHGRVERIELAPFGKRFQFGVKIDGFSFYTAIWDSAWLSPTSEIGRAASSFAIGECVTISGKPADPPVPNSFLHFIGSPKGPRCWTGMALTFSEIAPCNPSAKGN